MRAQFLIDRDDKEKVRRNLRARIFISFTFHASFLSICSFPALCVHSVLI